jgi:hypothetical protein
MNVADIGAEVIAVVSGFVTTAHADGRGTPVSGTAAALNTGTGRVGFGSVVEEVSTPGFATMARRMHATSTQSLKIS